MSQLRAGIVGVGVVGKALGLLIGPDAVLYDPRPEYCHDRDAVNACELAFVCVPSPSGADGKCDTSIVEEVVSWLKTPLIVIHSTVAPGTTDRLRKQSGKRIIFQPEYLGETTSHVYSDVAGRRFIVLGGSPTDTSEAADFYKLYYNAMVRFHFCDARTAEMAKYMENAFFAAKVTFVNEFCDIAKACGVDFNVLREIWLADARISRDHTQVYPRDRGFSGKCLPKDLDAIIACCEERGHQPRLLKAIRDINRGFRARNA